MEELALVHHDIAGHQGNILPTASLIIMIFPGFSWKWGPLPKILHNLILLIESTDTVLKIAEEPWRVASASVYSGRSCYCISSSAKVLGNQDSVRYANVRVTEKMSTACSLEYGRQRTSSAHLEVRQGTSKTKRLVPDVYFGKISVEPLPIRAEGGVQSPIIRLLR